MSEKLNRVIWDLIDDTAGRTYRSKPTDVPKAWTRKKDEDVPEWITYVSGEFEIERVEYGSSFSFHPTRQTCPIGDRMYPRLKDAKAACERNALGEEARHFA